MHTMHPTGMSYMQTENQHQHSSGHIYHKIDEEEKETDPNEQSDEKTKWFVTLFKPNWFIVVNTPLTT